MTMRDEVSKPYQVRVSHVQGGYDQGGQSARSGKGAGSKPLERLARDKACPGPMCACQPPASISTCQHVSTCDFRSRGDRVDLQAEGLSYLLGLYADHLAATTEFRQDSIISFAILTEFWYDIVMTKDRHDIIMIEFFRHGRSS
ncbi:hypothetical protein E5676_scaffold1333G00260 [Cucumis melo var. makuwa]|uniref:Uncharacterized protein n=1 Tax=Cucumis melo var. makuwa TaxID=1194695 RepID=A0A5A7TVK6_CUCMM|nr:hypothetical protein E6C27_scaffold376G00350 [Cucumis melo var. makuwa]TYK00205.1 hypothetical protein E5676_scaffold1333G00260 [Cucumis melo var. makuwa]